LFENKADGIGAYKLTTRRMPWPPGAMNGIDRKILEVVAFYVWRYDKREGN